MNKGGGALAGLAPLPLPRPRPLPLGRPGVPLLGDIGGVAFSGETVRVGEMCSGERVGDFEGEEKR